MFLLFIVFGALLLIILMAMNESGHLHNPPAEELAKYEALQAEEDRRRMERGNEDSNSFYDDDDGGWHGFMWGNSPLDYTKGRYYFNDDQW